MVNSSKINSFANTVKGLITSHNNDSSAHSPLFNVKCDYATFYGVVVGTGGTIIHRITLSSLDSTILTNNEINTDLVLFYKAPYKQWGFSTGELRLQLVFTENGSTIRSSEYIVKSKNENISENALNNYLFVCLYYNHNLGYFEIINVPTNYVEKSSTTGLLKNDGTVDTNTYLTSHQSLSNYVQKSSITGLVKNDGTIDTNSYSLSTHNHTGTYAPISHTQTCSTITDVEPINVVVTFDDETTQTLTLLKKTT